MSPRFRTGVALATAALAGLLPPCARAAAQVGEAPAAPSVQEWVVAAGRLHAAGPRLDSDSALALLRRALAAAPVDEAALEALVAVHSARVHRYGLPVEWYDTAVAYGERLARLNPAHGHTLLGRTYGLKGEQVFAVEALQRAVRYDSMHVPAVFALGLRYFYLGQHDRGIPVQLRTARLNPQSFSARNQAGFSYFHLDLPDLAEVQFRESDALGRTGLTVGGLLLTRLARGEDAAAIAVADSAWRADTTVAWTWARLGEAHLFAGDRAEAARLFEAALARDSAITNNYTWRSTALPLAYLHRGAGREERVPQLLARAYAHADEMLTWGQEPWNAFYQYAALALLEGDRAAAIRWLRTAHAGGMPGPVLIQRDPLFADLQGDPEFEEIVERLRWRAAEMRRRLGEGPSG
jgi:tetratricopeptide (TPR) repeat protein